MTLQELRIELSRCESLTKCDEFLRHNLHEIRPLFYGLTRQQLRKQSNHIEYENVFLAFTNSPIGSAIRAGFNPPLTVISLLIFFLSLFERAQLYTSILAVAELIPASPIRQQAEALFEYKNIQDAASNYIDRFENILSLLQAAWSCSDELGRHLSEDLLHEYTLDAILEPRNAGIDLRPAIDNRFRNPVAESKYSILQTLSLITILKSDMDRVHQIRTAVRSRIVEDLHAQACALVPDSLLTRISEDFIGAPAQANQVITRLPDHLCDQLDRMGAQYSPQRQVARFNFDADDVRNRIYLGTYFPKSVIESWNIFSELFSIPVIKAAYRQKSVIRLLDVGSGTGAAVVGVLLALNDFIEDETIVEVTAIDTNEDALTKQRDILDSLSHHLRFDLRVDLRPIQLPFDLDEFVPAFNSICDQEGPTYDLITCWKCLCEFYNVNYASANGIIRATLSIISRMLLPYGLCVISDVTTTDNKYEYFAITLNREANEHDAAPEAMALTILPLPCGRSSATCSNHTCYTQRRFVVNHRLARDDETKIAYRVLAPIAFAQSIIASFTNLAAYRVNAARPNEACAEGHKRGLAGLLPCGYTGFFAKGD